MFNELPNLAMKILRINGPFLGVTHLPPCTRCRLCAVCCLIYSVYRVATSCAHWIGLFLRLQRLFQIAAGSSSTVASNEKGLAIPPAPCYFVFRSGSLQRAPAAAARAGVPTFTLICFGFASSRFGMLSVSTPF